MNRFHINHITSKFTIPSGIITITAETLDLFARTVPQLGILTTKSIGVQPRRGNREPILCQTEQGPHFCNAVGLANPGVTYWKKEVERIYPLPNNKFLLTSIFGGSVEEFVQLVRELDTVTDGFELNLSCPHASGFGMELGRDPHVVMAILQAIRPLTEKPILLKVSPNLEDTDGWLSSLDQQLFDGWVAINTLGPYETREPTNNEPILSNQKGGASGPSIFNHTLRVVKAIHKISSLPVIAMGGINTVEQLIELEAAGASFFGIGSALAMMATPTIRERLAQLEHHWKSKTDFQLALRTDGYMKYTKTTIIQKRLYAPDYLVIHTDFSIKAEPGQFMYLWDPELGEKPYSIATTAPLSFVIKPVGSHSQGISNLQPGEPLWVRGPYGNAFPEPTNHPVYLIGGGTGLAPLVHWASKYPYQGFLVGCRELQTPIPLDIFVSEPAPDWIWYADKPNEKGLIIDQVMALLSEGTWDNTGRFYLCGPMAMEEAFCNRTATILSEKQTAYCIETYMKCGVGICGICATPSGERSCVDGPVLCGDRFITQIPAISHMRNPDGSLH
jgi:dihydroorotate dehydrogenase subfamily 1